jgi:hypothetical protein
MKKLLTLILLLTSVCLISACSSKENNKEVVTKDNQSYIQEYDAKLQEFIKQSNNLLSTFNKSLDGLYTQEYSLEQFASIMKKSIEDSNELISKIENYEVHPDIFDFHQQFIVHVNEQHQLFLDAVEMANTDQMDKDRLRADFLEIKQNQASLVNSWKSLKNSN